MVRHGAKEAETFKDQIAKTTLRLVADQGTDRVTTGAVVETMGITKAAMARHCPSEEDLWSAVTSLIDRRIKQAWSAVAVVKPSHSGRLRSLLIVQIGLIRSMPVLQTMLLSRSLHADNPALRRGLCEIKQSFTALLVEVLTEGQRTGEFREGLHAQATANRIVEAIQSTAVSCLAHEKAGDPTKRIWMWLDAFVHEKWNRVRAIDHDQCRPV